MEYVLAGFGKKTSFLSWHAQASFHTYSTMDTLLQFRCCDVLDVKGK